MVIIRNDIKKIIIIILANIDYKSVKISHWILIAWTTPILKNPNHPHQFGVVTNTIVSSEIEFNSIYLIIEKNKNRNNNYNDVQKLYFRNSLVQNKIIIMFFNFNSLK